ncbi:MAG: HD domain-containing protein [Actinobacteria bacterium]|nr:HD domain-containing protein [Actinomycetota bacterium]
MNDTSRSRFEAAMARHHATPAAASHRRPPEFVVLGARFDEALLYASAAHRQQARNGTPVPYLSHLLGVASLVLTHEGNEDQAIAALLHDTVEDCGVEHEPVIEELFGPAVLRMVLACTDARVPAGSQKPGWRGRKEAYLAHLEELRPGDEALLVSSPTSSTTPRRSSPTSRRTANPCGRTGSPANCPKTTSGTTPA